MAVAVHASTRGAPSVFTTSRQALPLLTVLMLGVSRLVREWGWALALALVAASAALGWMRRVETFRERTDALWLRVPVVGRLARGYNGARFAGTLAMLAGSGVPILRALQAAAETLSNRAMRADALDALALPQTGHRRPTIRCAEAFVTQVVIAAVRHQLEDDCH